MPRCGKGGRAFAFTLMKPPLVLVRVPAAGKPPVVPALCIRCQRKITRKWADCPRSTAGIHGEQVGPLCHPCLRVYPQEVEAAAERAVRVAARHWAKYRLTVADYWQLYRKQMGLCAICRDFRRCGKGLVIDHDHETGAVRALLCGRCNSAIGMLGDDPVNVDAARAYLLEHHARRSA